MSRLKTCAPLIAGALMAAAWTHGASAGEFKPVLTYAGDPFAVVGGDGRSGSTYAHFATAGGTYALDEHWSLAAVGAWTAGRSLSAERVGDIAGVQGVFNGGDQTWLYQLAVTGAFDGGQITAGRIVAGDYLGSAGAMGQFVNSAFSSNGGAISVNDPGRGASPASSWGAAGQLKAGGPVTLKGGVFLSDPARLAGKKHGLDFTFKPSDGVLGFGEVDVALSGGWTAGLTAYADSADLKAFDGRTVSGTHGGYVFAAGPLWRPAGGPKGRGLEGFVMLQASPQSDRSTQPFMALGGLVMTGPLAARPADVLGLAVQSGRLSRKAGLGGAETAVELNYRFTLNDRFGIRPDLQYISRPGGRDGDAVVAGVQLEFALGS